MESKNLLEKINSKHICKNIFLYLKNQTKVFQIAKYSKSLQQLIKINIKDYKIKSFELINDNVFLNYLSNKRPSKKDIIYTHLRNNHVKERAINIEIADKIRERALDLAETEEIKNKFKKYIEKYKVKEDIVLIEFSEFFFNNLYKEYKSKEKIKKNIINNQLIIDIYSPFFHILINKEYFPNLFNIRLPLHIIRKKNLKDDYIKVINSLKEYTTNFYSFYLEYIEKEDLNYLENINLNTLKIKKIVIDDMPIPNEYINEELDNNNGVIFYKNFYSQLFSLDNIKNNLVFLELKMSKERRDLNSHDILEVINKLNVLEELRLNSFEFPYYNEGSIEIATLKYLYLAYCRRIAIGQNCINLKVINLYRSFNILIRTNSLPELETFKSSYCFRNYNLLNCPKLKYLIRVHIEDFLSLNTINSLGKVYLHNESEYRGGLTKVREINMINKLISIKTLKEIKIDISFINKDEDLNTINGTNLSVEKLIIDCKNEDKSTKDIIFYNLQKKFPNLGEFQIYINSASNTFDDSEQSQIIELKTDSNCKINKFKYSGMRYPCFYKTKFLIGLYENLTDVEFGNIPNNSNLDKCFPIFNEKCENNFTSLIRFKFSNIILFKDRFYNVFQGQPNLPFAIDNTYELNPDTELKIIKNIFNNLDKMPNLQYFILKAKWKDIDEDTYKRFIKDLLLSNIKSIVLNINNHKDIYSENELKEICKGYEIKPKEKMIVKKYSQYN